MDDVKEGEQAEPADTQAIELIVCHPESVHRYAAADEPGASATDATFGCSLYDRAGISQLLEGDVAGVEYPSLSEAMSHAHVEGAADYIYVYDQATLEWFSDADRSALSDVFRAGAPVGLGGVDERTLAAALGLPDGHAGVLPQVRSAHFFHLHGSAVEQLAVELPNQPSFGEVLAAVMDWEETHHRHEVSAAAPTASLAPRSTRGAGVNAALGYVAAPSVGGAWDVPAAAVQGSVSIEDGWHYCKSYDYSGKVRDGDKDVGGYNMKYTFYYVDKPQVGDNLNRWLVVSELTSSMSNYYTEDGNKHKGWYMRKMGLAAKLSQYVGDIDEWSPSTSVGSTTTSSTIGGSIGASGPGVDYSVTTTNSTTDVKIEVDGDLSNNDGVNGQDWVEWGVEFARCGTNNSDTKLKDPSAAGQGIWKEQLAFYTVNADDNEGVKVMLAPSFRAEHCRCGSSSCPIRSSTTYYPFGTDGSVFQVFSDTCG